MNVDVNVGYGNEKNVQMMLSSERTDRQLRSRTANHPPWKAKWIFASPHWFKTGTQPTPQLDHTHPHQPLGVKQWIPLKSAKVIFGLYKRFVVPVIFSGTTPFFPRAFGQIRTRDHDPQFQEPFYLLLWGRVCSWFHQNSCDLGVWWTHKPRHLLDFCFFMPQHLKNKIKLEKMKQGKMKKKLFKTGVFFTFIFL